MDPAARRRLGDIFIERGLITEYQLEEALRRQRESGGKLGEILVDLGYVTRVTLAGVIGEQWEDLRLTQQPTRVAPVSASAPAPVGVVSDKALRARIDMLTAELAARDRRIAEQNATIADLLARLGNAAA
jgi:MSHA biogenesis protein MshE